MITTEEYKKALKIVSKYQKEREKEGFIKLKSGEFIPEYVNSGDGTILLYKEYCWQLDGPGYHRTAGEWAIRFELREEKVFCIGGQIPDLVGKELKLATRKQYLKSNRGYLRAA